MSEQSDHEKARDLMRRLVEVANKESDGRVDGYLSETFRAHERTPHVAELVKGYGQFIFRASDTCPLLAVQQLIAKTPWAGRVL